MTDKVQPQTIVENEDPALTQGKTENIYPQNFQDIPPLTDANVNVTVNCVTQNISNTFNYPYGTNSEVQFKNAGKFSGDPGLTYNQTSHTLCAQNLQVSGVSCLGPAACLRIGSGSPGYVLTKLDNSGNVVWCNPSALTASPVCIGTVDVSNNYTNVLSNVQRFAFDSDSGFAVSDLGGGTAKIAMNSTFKYWDVNGAPGLIACGLDTVNFAAGCNISISANNESAPKTLTITGPTISAGNNIAIGTSGNTLTICGTSVTCPGGTSGQVQYNNGTSFAGASGLTYDSTACSVGMTKITVPQNQNLQINVSNSNPAWWSLYGDPSANTVEDYSSGVVYDSNGNSYIIGANGDDGIPFLVKYDTYGNIVWQKVFNEANNYYKSGDAVAVDSSNNVYCLVGTDDSVNDVTIFKITSSGTVVWQTTITASIAFTPYISGPGLAVDSVGNVYASLYYDNSPDESQTLIKLNSSGVLQWQKVVSGNVDGYPQGLTVDSSDNIIMNGQYALPSTVRNVLLTKFDSNGNLLWQKGFANPFDSAFMTSPGQVATDSINNIIVNIRYQTVDNYSNGSVVKLDSNGNLLWQVNFPGGVSGPGYQFYGAAVDSSNNIYVTGYGGASYSNVNFYTIKLNSAGSIQWQRSFGSSDSEYAYWYWAARMLDVSNTNYVINGYSYAKGGNADAITAQLPTDGSLTGTYGLFTYEAVTLTTNTTEFIVSTPSMPVSDGSLVTSAGIYTVTDGANTEELVKIGGGDNSFNINSDGTIELPSYSFPFADGQNCQYLTTNGEGTLSWSIPIPGLDNNCSIAIRSCGNTAISGFNNFAVGRNALYCNINGGNNVAIGFEALYCNSTYGNNLGIGANALRNNTNGYSNVAIGYGSQSNNNAGNMNIGIGYDTLKNICSSNDNIALGGASQYCTYTGNHNISLGWQSLRNHVSGNDNIAIGADSQNSNICGWENISLGSRSLFSNTTGYRNIAIGTYPLYRNTDGDGNIAIGIATLEYNTTGSGSVAIGEWALQNNRSSSMVGIGQGALSQNTTGLFNTAIGHSALLLNTIGSCNTAIGYGPLTCNTAGCSNTVIGFSAHRWGNGGSGNTAVGALALESSSGQCNVAVGAEALRFNTTGQLNVAIGSGTLACNTIGYGNTAVGYQALNKNSTGNWNIAIGLFAAQNNLVGQNIAIGDSALNQNTIGVNHVAIGSNALRYNTTGLNNTAVGNSALLCNTIGSCNFALGQSALRCNATGCANVAIGVSSLEKNCGSWNVAIGNGSLYQNTTGEFNLAIGANALENNTIGFRNVSIGRNSMLFNTCGGENMAIGFASLYLNTTGSFNTAIGGFAMYGNTTGCRNTAIGLAALRSTRNNENVAIGFNTLFNTLGGCNTAIGASAGYGMTNGCNNTLIGWSASAQTATSCNTITLGNSSISCIRAQVTTISALSDQRDKTNVQDLPLGLQFILDLRPVKFTWNMRDGGKVGVDDTGFIAQEVLSVEDKYDVGQYLDMVGRENPDKLEVKPGKLIPILVRAIQELNEKVEAQNNIIKYLQSKIT